MNRIAFAIAALCLFSVPAAAADYRCKGDRVEQRGSTKYTVKTSGSDYTVKKSGSTRGKAVKSGSKYQVKVSGSTKATIEGNKIKRNGSTWASVRDAQRVFDCPDVVAATLWVLMKNGEL